MGKMTVLKPDGSTEVTDGLDKCPNYTELNKAIGGSFQTVPYFDKYNDERCVAFCNEEGKILGLPYNEPAQHLWLAQVGLIDDYLVGDIVILQGDAAFMRSI